MTFNKYFMILLFLSTNFSFNSLLAIIPIDNTGLYVNLSNDEKMQLIIAALDDGLCQIFVNYQNNKNQDQLFISLGSGIEKNKAIFSAMNIILDQNAMYLKFFDYCYFLCKFGKAGQFLATLSAEDRISIFNLCYNGWLTYYTDHLNENLAFILDDLNEFFVTLNS
ncbi:hypothetical protein KBB68_01840 [Candidatus Babeliales bacterium]|nr:hypothetical protein [Candidatus Babeliales bacterium]